MIYLIIICIILIIYIFYKLIFNKLCNSNLDYYIYDTDVPGPTILMIGGTHGNEPAGSISIKNLQKKINNKNVILNKGKLILIPELNSFALRLNIRSIPFIGDMNRKYPSNANEISDNCIINQIIQIIENTDIVIDFHEGWGYHKINKNSIGSTITPTNTDLSKNIASIIQKKLNNTISDENKKFEVINSTTENTSINIKGSLQYFMDISNKNYILVETTGQNNIQPLHVRTSQCDTVIQSILENYC